jgi:hypothetical protein
MVRVKNEITGCNARIQGSLRVTTEIITVVCSRKINGHNILGLTIKLIFKERDITDNSEQVSSTRYSKTTG